MYIIYACVHKLNRFTKVVSRISKHANVINIASINIYTCTLYLFLHSIGDDRIQNTKEERKLIRLLQNSI